MKKSSQILRIEIGDLEVSCRLKDGGEDKELARLKISDSVANFETGLAIEYVIATLKRAIKSVARNSQIENGASVEVNLGGLLVGYETRNIIMGDLKGLSKDEIKKRLSESKKFAFTINSMAPDNFFADLEILSAKRSSGKEFADVLFGIVDKNITTSVFNIILEYLGTGNIKFSFAGFKVVGKYAENYPEKTFVLFEPCGLCSFKFLFEKGVLTEIVKFNKGIFDILSSVRRLSSAPLSEITSHIKVKDHDDDTDSEKRLDFIIASVLGDYADMVLSASSEASSVPYMIRAGRFEDFRLLYEIMKSRNIFERRLDDDTVILRG